MKKQPKGKDDSKLVVKTKKNHYFTKIHEEAIIEYINSTDKKYREELYVNIISPVLSEMVDKIIYTYKFTSLPNIECLKEECKVWLVTVLNKFAVEKGFKAFSYFSVITKNWFIHRVKKCSMQCQKEMTYNELPYNIEQQYMATSNNYVQERDNKEFWESLCEEIKYCANDIENLRVNEQLVLNSVLVLMENVEDIEIYNKKAFFLYIRELSGLSSKQIVQHLTRLRERYREFKSLWEEF